MSHMQVLLHDTAAGSSMSLAFILFAAVRESWQELDPLLAGVLCMPEVVSPRDALQGLNQLRLVVRTCSADAHNVLKHQPRVLALAWMNA